MAPNLAIAIVPGSFSPASLYSTAVVKLKAAGFSTVKVLQYPSIGLGDGNQGVTMADDAQYLHSELEKLLDAGHDVVVNAHSYGGMPASESLKGLSKKQRAADGKKGGVVGMIYTAAIVPRPGQSSNDVMGGGTDVPVTPFIQIHVRWEWVGAAEHANKLSGRLHDARAG